MYIPCGFFKEKIPFKKTFLHMNFKEGGGGGAKTARCGEKITSG
jgi:hypothetical protein